MERIYTDTYDFEEIRTKGAVYVDKTDRILRLVDSSVGKQFFLSRPRRFGKSLLISTIQNIFQGNRDLFKGLALDRVGWDWEGETCPVLRLDMSTCSGTMEQVENRTSTMLAQLARNLGVPLHKDPELSSQLSWLIQDAALTSPTGKVVVLIDEYDKPLLQYVGTPECAPFQQFLKQFYSVIKATEGLQRFCLISGVSKFSKVSIFSDLNNLIDITMSPLSSTLLGYTHEEVRTNFPEALKELAATAKTDVDGAFEILERWYDGYCFDKAMIPVFNPVSLGKALSNSDIKSFWFETGTPGWLMSYAKKSPINVDGMRIDEDLLGTFEPTDPNMTALLFQTGYLTIKDVAGAFDEQRVYRLGFPNREVANGFNSWLARAYSDASIEQSSTWQFACQDALRSGDVKAFVSALKSFFASIGYDLSNRLTEQAYQNVVVAILRFIGIRTSAEVTSSRGRADMVCESSENVFIIELKVATGKSASESAARNAIEQIRKQGYAEQYKFEVSSGSKRVQLLGIVFDCEIHNIAAWDSEDL